MVKILNTYGNQFSLPLIKYRIPVGIHPKKHRAVDTLIITSRRLTYQGQVRVNSSSDCMFWNVGGNWSTGIRITRLAA